MQPNPSLKRLGFSSTDRLAIIHTDDIGMCQASVEAYIQLFEFGLMSSAATMMPCPWAPSAAEFCRNHPDVDMGVHLTLTSEWGNYRWCPLTTRDPSGSLMDVDGYFPRTSKELQENGDPDAVQVELRAQIDRAIRLGIQPTHADTHMGTVMHPKFLMQYLQLAMSYHIPPMMFRADERGWLAGGLDAETAVIAAGLVQQLEEMGLPMLDNIASLPLDKPDNRFDQAKSAFTTLPEGITHFIIHPSIDTPELRAITPDWRARVADWQTFRREDLQQFIKSIGVHIIGYRALKDLMPQ